MKQFPIEQIDLKKVDIHNHFRDFKPIFSNPQDIEDFIEWKDLKLPILKEFLRLRKSKTELGLTPTESEFYFNNLFDYIYDVYRIPVEETYTSTIGWLKYLESKLVHHGLDGIIGDVYQRVFSDWESRKFLTRVLKKLNKPDKREVINYHTDIGEPSDYYISKKAELIESFWIKSSRYAGQPVCIEEEAYMRVHVYPEKVYIFGCDDSSYTYTAENEENSKEFANLLKCAAPVWNFAFANGFGKQFEFTN